MGFFTAYRNRRVGLTGPESVATLAAMERFFRNGKNWVQGQYHAVDGRKCLVGAAQSVHAAPIDDARYWLQQAIAERGGGSGLMAIESFNDSRSSYREIADVLARAKQLAMASQRPRVPALTYQPEDDRSVVTLELADLERVNRK